MTVRLHVLVLVCVFNIFSMKKNTLKRQVAESIREIVFGLEDSLVSTLGAITGIAL